MKRYMPKRLVNKLKWESQKYSINPLEGKDKDQKEEQGIGNKE